jgi:glycosyltransferase involved in cell wall biosynthesis
MDFIDDEREFNAIMHASDILFAVYTDFPYSSNMLSKAANLRRPILVSDRYLMGELVRRYGIGIAVPEDDPSAAYLALEKLQNGSVSEESYANYCKNFSAQSLGDALEQFICRCLKVCQ